MVSLIVNKRVAGTFELTAPFSPHVTACQDDEHVVGTLSVKLVTIGGENRVGGCSLLVGWKYIKVILTLKSMPTHLQKLQICKFYSKNIFSIK